MMVGLWSLVFPRNVQNLGLKYNTKYWGFPNPLYEWMKTTEYLWILRIIGMVCILTALFFEFVVFFGRH
jgi:hypothetical protein